jgi:hypothetical protein
MAAAAGASVVLVLVGACSGSSGDTGTTSPASSSPAPNPVPTGLLSGLPTGLPTSLPGGGRVASGTEALKQPNVPPNFPIPPGAKVNGGTSNNDQSALTLTGVSTAALANFYRTALPAAGYTITNDNQVAGLVTAIQFQGHGVTGNIDTAGIGTANGAVITFHKQ